MSKDSSLENKDENVTVRNTIEEAIRDKLFNKLFAYVVVSFFVVNWQDIIILFRSKYDIYTTLSIVWVGEKYHFPYVGPIIVSPFVAHFVMPFIYGTTASVVMPYITMCISKATGRNYARIRYIDYEFDLEERARIKDLQINLKQKESKLLSLEKQTENQYKLLSAIEEKKREIESARVNLYHGIKVIVDIYKAKKKRISTQEDFADLLKAIEESDFYKDTGLWGINKLIDDVETIYESQSTSKDK
ncbi:hypothetical protein ACKWSL_004080 [Salmonella enterica]